MAYFGVTATSSGLEAAGDPGEGLTDGLRRALASVAPGAPLVVLVHGWKFHPGIPDADPHRSLYAFRPDPDRRIRSWPAGLGFADDAGESGLAIGFAWPAHAPHLSSMIRRGRTGFAEVYDRAGDAGVALATLIALVHDLAPGRPVDVLAHSLGARVALAALPHLDRAPDRMVLLGAAELAPRAGAFIAARRAADAPAVYNVTARTNDFYDLALECFVPRRRHGEQAIGMGLAGADVDRPAARPRRRHRLGERGGGIPLSPETARCCHWGFYTRRGALALYQAILRRRPGWDVESLRRLPCFAAQEPRWSRLLPARRPALPRLGGHVHGVALE